jgi:hypothetical protein
MNIALHESEQEREQEVHKRETVCQARESRRVLSGDGGIGWHGDAYMLAMLLTQGGMAVQSSRLSPSSEGRLVLMEARSLIKRLSPFFCMSPKSSMHSDVYGPKSNSASCGHIENGCTLAPRLARSNLISKIDPFFSEPPEKSNAIYSRQKESDKPMTDS